MVHETYTSFVPGAAGDVAAYTGDPVHVMGQHWTSFLCWICKNVSACLGSARSQDPYPFYSPFILRAWPSLVAKLWGSGGCNILILAQLTEPEGPRQQTPYSPDFVSPGMTPILKLPVSLSLQPRAPCSFLVRQNLAQHRSGGFWPSSVSTGARRKLSSYPNPTSES